jgi:hypothetical protein
MSEVLKNAIELKERSRNLLIKTEKLYADFLEIHKQINPQWQQSCSQHSQNSKTTLVAG